MAKMFDNIGRKIDAKLDAQVKETLVKQQERMVGELANNADAQLSSGTARLESENEASLARHQNARLNLADSANASSATYATDALALSAHHDSQLANLRANSAAALSAGMARGESMHAAGLRHRAPAGPVLITPEQANGYIQFREGQRTTPGPWADAYVVQQGSANNNTALSDYIKFSKGNSDAAKALGVQTQPTILTGAVDDFLVGGSAAVGAGRVNRNGLFTLQSSSGKEIGYISQSAVLNGSNQLAYIENSRANRLIIHGQGGLQSYAAGAAGRGGAIGALTAPIGSVISASINGQPITDPNGVFGLNVDFATNVSLDLSKGALSGVAGALAAGYVGAAIGSSVPFLGTAIGFTVGLGVGYLASEYGVESFYKLLDLRPEVLK